jgi:hypothetical protein
MVYLFLYEYKPLAFKQLDAAYVRLNLQRAVQNPSGSAASETYGVRGWSSRKDKQLAEGWFERATRLEGEKRNIL